MHKLQWILNNIISTKFIFRIICIIGIVLLGVATAIFTYKSCLDMFDFFKLKHWLLQIEREFSLITGALIGLATVIQSAPIVWDKLSYWGQCVDNFIIKILTKKIYFIDKAFDLMNQISKSITKTTKEFQQYYWIIIIETSNTESRNLISNKLDNLLKKDIPDIIQNFKNLEGILKKYEAYDNTNREKKADAERQLNLLGAQVIDICSKIIEFKNFITKKKRPTKITQQTK